MQQSERGMWRQVAWRLGIPGSEVPLVQDRGGSLSVSEVPAFQELGGSLNPLLNSIGKDNIPSDHWLIDSGASCCVVNK